MSPRRTIDVAALPERPPMLAALTAAAWHVVVVARELLERDGSGALTMAHVAAELDVRTPALYKHVADKAELERLLVCWGLWELGTGAHARIAAAEDADRARAMTTAYREWALANPALYVLTYARPLADDDATREAELVTIRAMDLAIGSASEFRAPTWGMMHGLLLLEINQRFPPWWDPDERWNSSVDVLYR